MKALLEDILKNITQQPEAVVIDQTQEDDTEVYTITVAADDMGRVIGKSGKVIRAIRTLMHIAGIRNAKKIRVQLKDTEGDRGQAEVLSGESDAGEGIVDLPAEETIEEPGEQTPQEPQE